MPEAVNSSQPISGSAPSTTGVESQVAAKGDGATTAAVPASASVVTPAVTRVLEWHRARMTRSVQ